MSGIAGFLDWTKACTANSGGRRILRQIIQETAHLGPDGDADHYDDTVALVQYLDWQTPESKQVTAVTNNSDSGTILVGDLRIDNRDDLFEKLALHKSEVNDWSDERLVLGCYERWGIDLVDRLLGDYAFAIWDRRASRLLLVRDALGMRPLYYYPASFGILFGSEVRCVSSHVAFTKKICRKRVADYLGLAFEDDELTFLDGLVRLPPGSVLEVKPGSVAKRKYYQLSFGPELKLRDNREYSDRFREIFTASVDCRLRANGPVGFLLSGGLDSSSIVGAAQQSNLTSASGPMRTFSAVFPDYPEIDERAWIDDVLASGSFSPTLVRVDRLSPIEKLASDIRDRGEPYYAPNNYVDSALLDAAQASGVRVVIDGLDGDTTVGHGWEYLGELLRRGKWRRLMRLARELASHTDKSTSWFLWRHAVAPTIIGTWARVRGPGAISAPSIMRRSFASEVGWGDRVRGWRTQRGFDLLSDFRDQHYGKLRSGLMAMCFEVASHQAGVRGMVRRHPYFDRRLVEYCVSLPAEQRLHRGVDRIIQRRAVEGLCPESIRTRLTKSIWVRNFADRLALNESQRIGSWLTKRASPVSDFVDLAEVRRSCAKILAGRANERTLAEIWVVLSLDVWLTEGW